MAWWQKMVFPVRRVWFAVAARVKTRKDAAGGILKLHNDVQTCGYEDVQVMWEMLRRSEMEVIDAHTVKCKQQQRGSLWRLLAPSRRSSACGPVVQHHHSNP